MVAAVSNNTSIVDLVAKANEVIAAVNSAVNYPTGVVIPFSTHSLAKGFLWCDGSAISREAYSDLYSVIGTDYGVGDGETTFNIPNLSDNRFIEGAATGGTYIAAGVPNHYHTATASRPKDVSSWDSGGGKDFGGSICITQTAESGSTVQPPSLSVRYAIKY